MFTVDVATKSLGFPIVPGKTQSVNNIGYIMMFTQMFHYYDRSGNSTAISTTTSDYSESTTLLHDETEIHTVTLKYTKTTLILFLIITET